MHHEVQEFRDLGLEAPGFLGLTFAHADFGRAMMVGEARDIAARARGFKGFEAG
jgi:hypothetical protein